MKKLYSLILLMLLTGCATSCEPKIVYVPVWTPPVIEMPVRPVLISKGGTADEIARNAELDLLDLSTYAAQLEKIISKVFKINKQ